MKRITLLEKLALQAEIEAKRSTCSRLNVGALIWDERGVILSSGYNGALAGMPHCDHTCDCGKPWLYGEGPHGNGHMSSCRVNQPCDITMHAEANAILWAARRGVATEGQYIISTHAPCFRCSQLIIQAGIKAVYYVESYRLTEGVDLLQAANVRVVRI
jgi:dCMP deaminase